MSDSFDVTHQADLPERLAFQPPEPLAEREGLPRTYRMRADRHYVDEIDADGGRPVRMLSMALIESAALESGDAMRPLIESIRALGIVHPLLVRRHRDRYQVVAGRKRFAAAQVLRLETIPCLVHDVGPSETAALAAADNLMAGGPRLDSNRDIAAARQLATEHIRAIIRASDLTIGHENTALGRSGTTILRAHAWRAAYLLDALDLLEHPPTVTDSRRCAIAAVVEEIVASASAEAQIRLLDVQVEMGGYYTVAVDRRQLTAALAGAFFATLEAIGDTPGATIVVRTFERTAGAPTVEFAQTHRNVTQAVLNDLLKPDSVLAQHVDSSAVIGALVARTITERCGGSIQFTASVGTRMTMTFPGAPRADAGRSLQP